MVGSSTKKHASSHPRSRTKGAELRTPSPSHKRRDLPHGGEKRLIQYGIKRGTSRGVRKKALSNNEESAKSLVTKKDPTPNEMMLQPSTILPKGKREEVFQNKTRLGK